MKRVMVTGATGFIGRHLVAELSSRQVETVCLLRREPPDYLRHELIECVQGELQDAASIRRACEGVDTVFHLAGMTHALTADDLNRTNGQACGVLADACLKSTTPPTILFVSSLAAAGPIGREEPPRTEAVPCRPVSDYGRSKRLGEIEFAKRAARLPISIVRPGIVCGPWDTGALPMFKAISRYRVHVVVGMRTPPLSLIGVDDLVRLIVTTAENGQRLSGDDEGYESYRGVYFGCDDRQYPTYAELGRMISDSLDQKAIVWPIWRWVGRGLGGVSQLANRMRGKSSMLNLDKIREAAVPSWACSSAKAHDELGWFPQRDLQEVLDRTATWYREARWL